MTFKVLKAGPMTTIQDAGRRGYSHLGLTEAGPMDYRSFAIANRLVGNSINTAALEIALGGLTLECQQSATIAVTGAYCPLIINGKAVSLWRTQSVQRGDIVELGFAALGVRAYLAVAGGFESPTWYGSQSVVLREGLGEALQPGDGLNLRTSAGAPPLQLRFADQPSLRRRATLYFVSGYQWEDIPPESQQRLLSETFTVSARNDRMGCQLEGAPIETGIDSIYSEGIAAGSVQVTGGGTPIILMRDRQTIGGYPKLGAVTAESQSVLAQLPQNSSIRFRHITAREATEQFRAFHNGIQQLEFEVAL